MSEKGWSVNGNAGECGDKTIRYIMISRVVTEGESDENG